LKLYEQIPFPFVVIFVVIFKWERDLFVVGRTQRGYEVEYDIKYEEGCYPIAALL
jgi:hypothetical protein